MCLMCLMLTSGQVLPFWTSHKTCLPIHRGDRHDVHLSHHDMASSTTVHLGSIRWSEYVYIKWSEYVYTDVSLKGQTPAGIKVCSLSGSLSLHIASQGSHLSHQFHAVSIVVVIQVTTTLYKLALTCVNTNITLAYCTHVQH